MTVTRLRLEMPHSEYIGWQAYYGIKAQRQQLAHMNAGAR